MGHFGTTSPDAFILESVVDLAGKCRKIRLLAKGTGFKKAVASQQKILS